MKIAAILFAIAFLSFMQHCTGPAQTAGGTTSTENARVSAVVVYSDGTPVSGAAVRFRDVDYLSDGTTVPPFDSYTDNAGRFSIDLIKNGDYLIEVADNRGNAAAIPCSVSNDSAIDLGTRTLVSMGRIEGTAGGPAVMAHLRIRGLERYVAADSGGRFSVSVPSGRSYSVNIATPDTAIDLPPTGPIEPSQTVTVAADLGTFTSDSIAVRAFMRSHGMAAVPLDSIVRLASEKRIRALFLRRRNLAALPASVGNLTFLWEIDAGENPLDSLPETLKDLPLLSHLFLDATPLKSLPEVVCRCGNLKWLNLSETAIRTLPLTVASLTALRVLEMSGNTLTEMPPAVCLLSSLIELSVARNQLTRLPEAIGGCSNLEILHLDDNQLESLPDAITQCRNLRIIYAYRNNLVSLPDSIGRLTQLTRLEIQENRLAVFPASIRACTNLKYLNLWGNKLAGLPAGIENVKPSDGLTIGGNRLCTLSPDISAWADAFAESAWKERQECTGTFPVTKALLP